MSTYGELEPFRTGSCKLANAVDRRSSVWHHISSNAAGASQQARSTAPLSSASKSRSTKRGAISPVGGFNHALSLSPGLPHEVCGSKASSFGVRNRFAFTVSCASTELAGSKSMRWLNTGSTIEMMRSGVVQSPAPGAIGRAAARSPATSCSFASSSPRRALYAASTDIVPARTAGPRMGSPRTAFAFFTVAGDTSICCAASFCEINSSVWLLVPSPGGCGSVALRGDCRDLARGAWRFPTGSPPPTGRPFPRTGAGSSPVVGAEISSVFRSPTSSNGGAFGFPASPPLRRLARSAATIARCEVVRCRRMKILRRYEADQVRVGRERLEPYRNVGGFAGVAAVAAVHEISLGRVDVDGLELAATLEVRRQFLAALRVHQWKQFGCWKSPEALIADQVRTRRCGRRRVGTRRGGRVRNTALWGRGAGATIVFFRHFYSPCRRWAVRAKANTVALTSTSLYAVPPETEMRRDGCPGHKRFCLVARGCRTI